MAYKETYCYNVHGRDFVFFCSAGRYNQGFKHDAALFVNGEKKQTARKSYGNRTWETFPFQSAMLKALAQEEEAARGAGYRAALAALRGLIEDGRTATA